MSRSLRIEARTPATGGGFRFEWHGVGISAKEYYSAQDAAEYIVKSGTAYWEFRIVSVEDGRYSNDEQTVPITGWTSKERMIRDLEVWKRDDLDWRPSEFSPYYEAIRPSRHKQVTAVPKQKTKTTAVAEQATERSSKVNMTLNIKRTELIGKLQARLATLQQTATEVDEGQERAKAQLLEALAQVDPSKIGWIIDVLCGDAEPYLKHNDKGEIELLPGLEKPVQQSRSEQDRLGKWISALEISEDKTLPVSTEDDLWKYL